MARTGITYIDVSKAAESLKESCIEPTVDRVREVLGTGSKSTIAPHLKQWRTRETNGQDKSGLPSDILASVKSLVQRTQDKANAKIELANSEFQSTLNELQDKLEQSQKEIDNLKNQKRELTEELTSATRKIKDQTTELADRQLQHVRSQAELDASLCRVKELTAFIDELKRDNRQTRAHLEHYQNSLAEDRANERENHESSKQAYELRISELEKKLNKSQKDQSSLKDSHSANLNKLSRNELEFKTLHTRYELLLKERDFQTEELDSIKLKFDNLNKSYQLLQVQNSQDQTTLATLTSKIEGLKEQNLFSQKAIEGLNQKLEVLSDEKITLTQEKSVIQGKYIQLQNSI